MKKYELSDERYVLKAEYDRIQVLGDIDVRDPKYILGKFIQEVHQRIIDEKIKKITIDVQKLGFINSVGIKEFAAWIMLIDRLDNDQQYKIQFLLNKGFQWQKMTFTALKWLNEKSVELKDN